MKTFSITKNSYPFASKMSVRDYGSCGQLVPISNERALLVTSNGFALSAIDVPIEGNDKDTCLMSFAAMKHAEGLKACVVEANGGDTITVKNRLSNSTFRKPSIDYPDWTQVLPERKQSRMITLNADFLYDLAKGLNKHCSVTLHLTEDDTDPIMVTGDNGFGVIFPIECDAKDRLNIAYNAVKLASETLRV